MMTVTIIFNPDDNGGQQLSLTTKEDGVQIIELQSYWNCASFSVTDFMFSPQKLRRAADEIEELQKKIKNDKNTV